MLCRLLAFAGLLLVSGCAYDAGYYETGYASQAGSAAGDYSPVDYTTPYLPNSPVYGSPYVEGPVMGPIYSYGDDTDYYGGPIFSPYHGITCDRRQNVCWSQYGPDPRWSYRFFGRRHANWDNDDGHHGNGHHGNGGGNGHGGNNPNWPHGGNHNQGGGNNPNHDRPWIYQVPKEPDGSGAPTFYPNGCGGNGQPPC